MAMANAQDCGSGSGLWLEALAEGSSDTSPATPPSPRSRHDDEPAAAEPGSEQLVPEPRRGTAANGRAEADIGGGAMPLVAVLDTEPAAPPQLKERGQPQPRASETGSSRSAGPDDGRDSEEGLVDNRAQLAREHSAEEEPEEEAEPKTQHPSLTASSLRWNVSTLALAEEARHELQDAFQEFQKDVHGAVTAVQAATIGFTTSSTAFITFNTVTERFVAEQVVLSKNSKWIAKAAPEADSIIWENVACTEKQNKARRVLVGCLCHAGLIFWSVPVFTIQAWSRSSVSWFPEEWFASPVGYFVHTALAKYAPVCALIALQVSVPYILQFISVRYERMKRKAKLELRVLQRNFKFQLATVYVSVFCVTLSQMGMFSESTFELFAKIVDQPVQLFEMLEYSVPKVALFFMNFVLTKCCLTIPLQLWKAVWMYLFWYLPPSLRKLMLKYFPALEQPQENVNPQYSRQVSELCMVLVLAMTYCVISPMLMPFCALFFAVAFLVNTWNFLYVYTPKFDCLGHCWFEFFRGAMSGLLLSTLAVAAVMQHSGEFYAMLLLCGLVLASYMGFKKQYWKAAHVMSLEDASKLDARCGHAMDMLRPDYYLDPILRSEHEGRSSDELLFPVVPSLDKISEGSRDQNQNDEPPKSVAAAEHEAEEAPFVEGAMPPAAVPPAVEEDEPPSWEDGAPVPLPPAVEDETPPLEDAAQRLRGHPPAVAKGLPRSALLCYCFSCAPRSVMPTSMKE